MTTSLRPREVRVLPDLERLSHEAATHFVRIAAESIGERGCCSVALSGGRTPQRLYELLAAEPYRHRVPWDLVHVFWADERCVPHDHPESNFGMASAALLSHVPIPHGHVYRAPGELGDPEQVALGYEATLRRFFRLEGIAHAPTPQAPTAWPQFDLVLLGVGEDGHIASLFPGSDALHERARLVVGVRAPGLTPSRVTLTLPVLNHARSVIVLAAGANKAPVVRAVLERPGKPAALPAQRIRPSNGTHLWLVDQAAASRHLAGS